MNKTSSPRLPLAAFLYIWITISATILMGVATLGYTGYRVWQGMQDNTLSPDGLEWLLGLLIMVALAGNFIGAWGLRGRRRWSVKLTFVMLHFTLFLLLVLLPVVAYQDALFAGIDLISMVYVYSWVRYFDKFQIQPKDIQGFRETTPGV